MELPARDSFFFRDIPQLVGQYVNGNETLDYGCGLGRSTRFLKSLGLNVDAVDVSEETLNRIKKIDPLGNYEVLENDGTINSGPDRYDLVFSSFALAEIGDRKELFDTVAEIGRVTKTGGTFITFVNHEDGYNQKWLGGMNGEPLEDNELHSGLSLVKPHKKLLDVNNYFWTDEDYQKAIRDAGFSLECAHKPIDDDADEKSCRWALERVASPVLIYVARKL